MLTSHNVHIWMDTQTDGWTLSIFIVPPTKSHGGTKYELFHLSKQIVTNL